MLDPSLAARYAHALHGAAAVSGQGAAVCVDLDAVRDALKKNHGLWKLLIHPAIPAVEKRNVLRDIFQGRISALALNFLSVLMDEKRAEYIHLIRDAFHRLVEADENRKQVTVETAFPLSAPVETRLRDTLSGWLHAEVDLEIRQKPGLLGGVRIQIGNRLLDGSLLFRLREMEAKLTSA